MSKQVDRQANSVEKYFSQIVDRVFIHASKDPKWLKELLDRYPQRNLSWHMSTYEDSFTAEISELGNPPKDPWGRNIRWDWFKAQRDREGEITEWIGYTTVKGDSVQLTIFND